MRRQAFRHGFPWVVVGILILPTLAFAQKAISHVRVVRLSYVSGTVGVKRAESTEWAKGQVNTPIQEGFEVLTAAHSYAEVEFENGSTTRLGEFSKVKFDQLEMDENGNKLNRLTFAQGYATFHLLPEHHDAYSIKVADATLTPNGKSEFRTDLERRRVRVEVFSGSIELATSAQKVKLGKDKIVEFEPDSTEVALNQKQGITKDAWDKWTSERDTQEQLSVSDQAVPSRGLMYGWGDLDAYGEWGFFPGFGYGWSPYVSAGWSPYSMGMWSMYPGMGYAWISGEPWGWLPYHYGNWGFTPGFGWFWMPGSMSAWSPATVSWYSGPSWIGWSPLGRGGVAGQRMLNTIPGSVVPNGQIISPENVNHVPARLGTLINHMVPDVGAGGMLPGAPLSANEQASFTSRVETPHTTAPASILVGGDPAKEQAPTSRHAAHQPLRAQLGTTLGGHYIVGGVVGEFRGDAIGGEGAAHGPSGMNGTRGPGFSRGPSSGGPVLLSHGQNSSAPPSGGGGAMAPHGGGGYGGGAPATSSGASSSAHSGGGGSSGGGHH